MAEVDEEAVIAKLYDNERGAMLDYGVPVERMLAALENNLPFFADDDQEFVQSMVLLVGTGSPLVPAQIQRLAQLMGTLKKSSHNTMGESLSMAKVAKDLAGAIHTLRPDEKKVLVAAVQKLQQKVPLSIDEIQRLLDIYQAKGF